MLLSTCSTLTGQLTWPSHPHRCLVVRNERIISNSVARLRPHHAAALLECAVERLRARARRGPELTVWIRAVLTHHHRLPHGRSRRPAHPSNTVTGENLKVKHWQSRACSLKALQKSWTSDRDMLHFHGSRRLTRLLCSACKSVFFGQLTLVLVCHNQCIMH